MRIVFCGTSKFSVQVLEQILKTNNEVVAVCTQPDKINARNNKIEISPIKSFCLKNGLNLLQFKSISKEGEQILKDLQPDMLISASFGQIFRKNILEVAKHGIINVHGSLLPKYRGAAPIQTVLINGEKETGITIMQTEEGIDCGAIYLVKKMDILPDDNAITLFDRMGELGGVAITEFLNNFELCKANAHKQNEAEMTYYPMLKKEDAKIDFNNTTKNVVGKIKGYAMLPAYFEYKERRFNVYNASVFSVDNLEKKTAGTILMASGKRGLHIATCDGIVEITSIQPENKKVMTGKECMNGRYFIEGDII